MLKDISSSAIVAVSDMPRARTFYEQTLGLTLLADKGNVLIFQTGATTLVVYRSEEAGSNRANAVVWGCGDAIDAVVADLEAKDVSFEHYPQLGGIQLKGNTHIAGSMKMVWFKDPDGNILHLNNS